MRRGAEKGFSTAWYVLNKSVVTKELLLHISLALVKTIYSPKHFSLPLSLNHIMPETFTSPLFRSTCLLKHFISSLYINHMADPHRIVPNSYVSSNHCFISDSVPEESLKKKAANTLLKIIDAEDDNFSVCQTENLFHSWKLKSYPRCCECLLWHWAMVKNKRGFWKY